MKQFINDLKRDYRRNPTTFVVSWIFLAIFFLFFIAAPFAVIVCTIIGLLLGFYN